MTGKRAGQGSRKKKDITPGELRRIVAEGYRKLALGPVGDAVKLLMAGEGDRLDYGELDLMNLAEVRRGKGVIELRFFDRLAALDRLAQLAREEESQGMDRFCAALSQGARELYRDPGLGQDQDHGQYAYPEHREQGEGGEDGGIG